MKRIYLTLSLLGALAMGANAQIVDLEGVIVLPEDGQTLHAGSTIDTNKLQLYIIYHGPDDITSADAVFFMSSFSLPAEDPNSFYLSGVQWNADITSADSGNAIFRFPSQIEGHPGIVAPYVAAIDSINLLIDWELWSTQDSLVLATKPYQDGKEYGFYWRPVRVQEVETGFEFSDPDPSNNIAIQRIIWSEEPSSLTDLFPAKTNINIELYPNPSTSNINFKFETSENTRAQYIIRDITGRIVKASNLGKVSSGQQTISIDISNLAAGSYSIDFSTDYERAVSKFTKK